MTEQATYPQGAGQAEGKPEGDLPLPCANWTWFIVRGILALALGVLAILFPFSALFAFTLVFAVFAFIDGVASVMSGIRRARNKRDRWLSLMLAGIAGIAVGAIFVLMPFVAMIAYALATLIIIAIWALLTGILEVAAAIRLRKEIKGEWLLALSGVLSILLGLVIPVILLLNPAVTILSVAWVIGVYAIAAGISYLVLAVRLRKRARTAGA